MKSVYLLLGPEQGEKIQYIEKIIRDITSKEKEEPEKHKFYAFEYNLVEIISLLRNGSLFSRHKVVTIANLELIKKKEDVSLLLEYLLTPSPDATLLLLSDTIKRDISKRIVGAVPEQNQKIFWEMYENKKPGWVKSYFNKANISIDQESTDFLLEMIENNTRDLKQECERLVQFFGPNTELKIESIARYIYHSKEENVFTLFDHVARRDLSASQEVLNKILLSKESDPAALMGGFLWQIRKLLDMKRLLEENYSLEETFAKLQIKSKKSQKTYINAHKSYTLKEVQSLITLIADFDIRLRTFKADLHTLLLQLFLYYAIKRGGKIPQPVLPD
jgi:DNA polymerase-3 subunit delta